MGGFQRLIHDLGDSEAQGRFDGFVIGIGQTDRTYGFTPIAVGKSREQFIDLEVFDAHGAPGQVEGEVERKTMRYSEIGQRAIGVVELELFQTQPGPKRVSQAVVGI